MPSSPAPALGPAEIEKICKSAASKFGLNKCLECSKAIAKALQRAGVAGERVQLKAQGSTRGFIVMKSASARVPFVVGKDEAIASNGQHFGVRVLDKIYCNVFREGVRASDWQKQFDCDTHKFSLSDVERF